MMLKQQIFFLFLLIPSSLFAWGSNGHKLVAEIAYENLDLAVQKKVVTLLQITDANYRHPLSFSQSAAWADWIRSDKPELASWHYIDLPYCGHQVCFQRVEQPNIVTAIFHEEAILKNRQASLSEQSEALRFYEHWLGDIHQPMHAITYYSPDYPQGDAGGNLYKLKGNVYPTLHAFWDGACGLWPPHQALSKKQLHNLAEKWQKQYPKSDFKIQLADQNPLNWAKKSHSLAIEYGYEALIDQNLSQNAQKNAQRICQSQMVLAGYRLAERLNACYAHG